MAITGYPDFSRLQDQEVAQQFKLVWDALIGVSTDVEGVADPSAEIEGLRSALATETARRQALERRVKTLEDTVEDCCP